jgi:hypothetical protein
MIHGASCACALPMKERTAHYFPQLQKICNAKKVKKDLLLEKTSNCLIYYLSDCCKGVLKNHIRFPKRIYKKLSKFRNDILLVANKKSSLKTKRAALLQKNGGFLPLILPALASAVFGVLGNLISKKFIK